MSNKISSKYNRSKLEELDLNMVSGGTDGITQEITDSSSFETCPKCGTVIAIGNGMTMESHQATPICQMVQNSKKTSA